MSTSFNIKQIELNNKLYKQMTDLYKSQCCYCGHKTLHKELKYYRSNESVLYNGFWLCKRFKNCYDRHINLDPFNLMSAGYKEASKIRDKQIMKNKLNRLIYIAKNAKKNT